MSMLLRFKNFIEELEQKTLYRYLSVAVAMLAFCIGLLFYYHTNKMSNLKKDLQRINRQRTQARELLEKHMVVKQQKMEVDEILLQDKTFKIKEYFFSTIAEMQLQKKISKDAEIAEPQDLDNGYTEIKLDASFTNMSMQELAELMYKIEKNRRIYTKELVITKALQSPTIDVTLIIATLQPKLES